MAQLVAGSQIASAFGTLAGGASADQAAKMEQIQYYQAANAAAASSEREAQNIQLQGKLIESRQQAVAAASGAGATDPTVLSIQGETARRTMYDTLSKIWEGQTERQNLRYAGDTARFQGSQQLMASGLSAIGSLAGAGKTLFDRYGGGGMPGADAVTGGSDAAAAGGSSIDFATLLSAIG